jgi:hypothetical protein
MANFTPTQLTELVTLAARIAKDSEHCGRDLLVGYSGEDGGVPEAWIDARPGQNPVISFEPPEWLSVLLFEDDDERGEDDDGPERRSYDLSPNDEARSLV